MAGGERRPKFFPVDQVCPQLRALEANFTDIRAELSRAESDVPLHKYEDVDAWQQSLASRCEGTWRIRFLRLFDRIPASGRDLPETQRSLATVPGVIQAFYSLLEGETSIPLHQGPYAGYLRFHLPLSIPRTNPPYLVVGGETHFWREGEGALFDDTWPHQACNPSQEARSLLVVDIRRPLPFPLDPINKATLRTVGRLGYASRIYSRVNELWSAQEPHESKRP